MPHFDAAVIGDGQGGDPLARAWAKAGRKIALIEKAQLGGTCVNTGCTPTKAMAAAARVAYLTRRAGEFGVETGSVTVSVARVTARAQSIVTDFRGGIEKKVDDAENLTVLRGEARFVGPKTMEIARPGGETTKITADEIFIDTGTRPTIPKIDGLENVSYLTNASIEHLETLPSHLIILGGSYIALEFGQMFRRFGSDVTIIERAAHLLAREDDDVAEKMSEILREDGIEIHVGAEAVRVETGEKNGVVLTVKTKDGETKITGSHLLVATGRTPNTDALGLDDAGIEIDDKGFVKTNARLETNVPGVYAMGDVKGGPAFTHISYDDFRILQANLLHGGKRTTDDRPVPYTVFTDPQLGRVGLSENEARSAGKAVKIAKLPMTEVARAIETGETRGFMKAVVDAKTDQILGCAMLGVNGGETMAVIEVAMLGKLPITALRDGVFSHPTLAESLNNLFMTLD